MTAGALSLLVMRFFDFKIPECHIEEVEDKFSILLRELGYIFQAFKRLFIQFHFSFTDEVIDRHFECIGYFRYDLNRRADIAAFIPADHIPGSSDHAAEFKAASS